MMRYRLPGISILLCLATAAEPPKSIGPFGGSATAVQVDPRRPGTVLAATSKAVLFRSTDGGSSWAVLPFPPALRANLHALVVVPNTGAYLVGLEADGHEYSGIYRSLDEGRTWTRLSAPGPADVWSVAVFQADSRVMAAGTADGVFLTRDGGEHWRRISPESNQELRPVVSLAFDHLDSQIIYAGTPHLPWRTTDGGVHWNPAAAGILDDSDIFSIAVSEPLRHVYASACTGIYRSVDGGQSWTKLRGADSASYRTYQIIQHPSRRKTWFAGTAQGLVRSTDDGVTWKRLSSELTRSVAFDSVHPGRLYAATDAGLFRSDDLGDTITPVNNGFSNLRVLSVAGSEDTLYATSTDGLLRLKGSRVPWEHVSIPLPGEVVVKLVPIDNRQLLALTQKFVLYSSDGGQSWIKQSPSVRATNLTDMAIPSLDRPWVIVSSNDGIHYSYDLGATWRTVRPAQGDEPVRSIVSLDARTIVALTARSLLLLRDFVNYEPVPLPAPAREIYSLVANGRGTLMAATSRGLRRSEDLGRTWQPVAGSLDGNTVSSICKHPLMSGMFFAARYGAIFRSVDDGRTWSRLTVEGQDLPSIKDLVIAEGMPTRLLALTDVQGIYSIPLSGLAKD